MIPTLFSYAPSELHLIILPTELCNFRCLYCYESHQGENMNDATERALITFLHRQIDIRKTIWVSWFGGEPLLRKKQMLRISRAMQEKSLERPDLKYFSSITTNGYLLDRNTFQELLSAGIRDFQITLDGPQHLHDVMRPLACGSGSYDTILQNICTAQRTTEDFSMLLRIHYTPDNLKEILKYKRELMAMFGGDKRFKFFFRPLSRLGGENDSCIKLFSKEEVQRINELFTDVPKENLFTIPKEGEICYAARPNSFAVRPNGTLVKCTVSLEDPSNHVGSINQDGTLKIDDERMWPWISGFLNANAEEMRCPLKKMYKDLE